MVYKSFTGIMLYEIFMVAETISWEMNCNRCFPRRTLIFTLIQRIVYCNVLMIGIFT